MKTRKHISSLIVAAVLLAVSAFHVSASDASFRFNGWQTVGPTGGDIRSVAIDPKDKSRLYATTLDSQVYTSPDAGKSWRFLVSFDRPQITLDNVLVDSEDSNIIYVTGHRHKEPGGFYYSKDAGATWKEAADLKNEAIHAVAQSSANPNLLIVGSAGRVFLSYNRGVNWTKMTEPNVPFSQQLVDSAAFDPKNPNTIFIGTTWRPYKSTDGGKTWRLISKGMIDDSDVFAIDIDPTNPDHIVSSACSGIYESFNGGELWSKVQGIPSASRRTRAIIRNPVRNGAVYAGTTEGFWMSADSGKTWALKSQRELEVNAIAVHPDEPNKIYLATNNYGLMVSTDGGQNFSVQNGNFTSRFMKQIVADIERPNRFYATTNNTATGGGFIFVSDDGGQTWTPAMKNLSVIRIKAFSLLQDKQNPETIYIGTNVGIFRSLDRGKSWNQVLTSVPTKTTATKTVTTKVKGKKVTKTVTVPVTKTLPVLKETVRALRYTNDGKNGMLAATDKGLYRTYNINGGWEKLVFGSGMSEQVYAVATGSAESGTIWAGTVRSGVLVSRDSGKTWQMVAGIPAETPISAIEVDSANPNNVYVGTIQTFYASRDGGLTFTRRGGGLPGGNYNSILINPNNSNEVYAGSSTEGRGGVFYSWDAGLTWKQLDTKDINLPTRRVWAMAFDPKNPNRILVGTHSSGIYRIEKDSPSASNDGAVRPRVAANGN